MKLKYLNSYDYIFHIVLFILSFEDRHFESREYMPVSHQNSQTSKEIDADISMFSKTLIVDYVVFPM